MALTFSTNNRFVGLGGSLTPHYSTAWLLFKTFMVNAGWTVVQSAAQAFSTTTDVIVDATSNSGGMSSPTVWWVMRDPAGVRELLFYRPNAITSNLLTAANMAIAYSAKDRFSTTLGHNNSPVSATNPPIANDMIWLHQSDKWIGTGSSPSLSVPGLMTDDVNWGGAVNYSKAWNIHMCAETTAPYPFYFWFTRNNETTGFFCMDSLLDTHSLDTDDVIFYHFPTEGGIANINSNSLKTWYKKPTSFTDRAEFADKITYNDSRFLPTSAMYHMVGGTISIPRGLPANIYDAKDELFPIMYVRNTIQPYYNEILSLPPSYKGMSGFLRLTASARNQFDTISIQSTRDKILIGSNPTIAAPWNGSIINI